MYSLKYFLGHSDLEVFLKRISFEPFYSGGSSYRFSSLYCESSFRHILRMASRHLRYPDIRLIKDGETLSERKITSLVSTEKHGTARRVDVEKIWQGFDSGCTIALASIHSLDSRLFDLSEGLGAEIGCEVKINAYYSPPFSRGFGVHFDTHDIIALQIYGKKNWRYSPPTFRHPLGEHEYSNFAAPERLDSSVTLTEGDLLYLPRGHWHVAMTEELPSLHLTVGLYRRTYADLLSEAMAILRRDERIRTDIPKGVNVDEISMALASEFRSALKRHIL